jgi:phosphate:Na+ symporter
MILSILGGLGLFLLGMSIMTDGLRALAGSALRTLLRSAAATPARGTFWGAVVTLIVQSSSATIMTTIGLVSAGLLTFPQALGVVLGANIGTTGTGWLVALVGVKISLTPATMPMLFVGALLRLVGRGRTASAGGAIAGFALLLFGLMVLQEGMAGLAERINPADLPTVIGNGGWRAAGSIALLVLAGIVMTTVMQSSSAAVAATLAALHAGAVGPDQAAALVVGQNIGSAVSSTLAAIGATAAAKRTALAHVLFNVVTGGLILALFPLLLPLLVRAAEVMPPPIMLASFHTAYNLLGVAILLPCVTQFARLVEWLIPHRQPILTRFLDRSSLDVPGAGAEAARRTVAGALGASCDALVASARDPERGGSALESVLREATEALDQTRLFLSEQHEPAQTEEERAVLADVLHALDHATRLAERAGDWATELSQHALSTPITSPMASADDAGRNAARATLFAEDERARQAAVLAARVFERVTLVAAEVASPRQPAEAERGSDEEESADFLSRHRAAAEAGAVSKTLASLRRDHRSQIMEAAARGEGGVNAATAIERAEAVRLLDRLAYHAWRAAIHLIGAAEKEEPAKAGSSADARAAAMPGEGVGGDGRGSAAI